MLLAMASNFTFLSTTWKHGCLCRVKMIQSPKRESFSRRVVTSPFPVLACFAHTTCSSIFTLFSSQDTEIFERYRVVTDDQSKSELLSVLKLRYFTPREVANLHGFPSDFRECYFFTDVCECLPKVHAMQLYIAASTRDKSLISI